MLQVDATKVRVDATKLQADALKLQFDTSKVQVNALKVQVDASKLQADASKLQPGREGENSKLHLLTASTGWATITFARLLLGFFQKDNPSY